MSTRTRATGSSSASFAPRHVRGFALGALACRTPSRINASCSGGAPSAPPSPHPFALLTATFLPDPTDTAARPRSDRPRITNAPRALLPWATRPYRSKDRQQDSNLRGDHPKVSATIAPDATTSVLPSSKRQRTMIQNHRAPWAHSTEVTAAIAPGDPDPTNPAPTRTTDLRTRPPTSTHPPRPAPRGLPPGNGEARHPRRGTGPHRLALLTDRRPCAGPPRGPCAPT